MRQQVIEEFEDKQYYTHEEVERMMDRYARLIAEAFGEWLKRYPIEAERVAIGQLFDEFLLEAGT